MRLAVALSLSFALIAVPGAAQNQALLERALEGREVTVLLEMPASHRGIDLHVQQEPEMDFSEYARRIKQHGVALRKEDRVMITAVKVNKKNIEVHLGGGGYGTWGDDSGTLSARYVGKSGRESDLEKERKRTKTRSASATSTANWATCGVTVSARSARLVAKPRRWRRSSSGKSRSSGWTADPASTSGTPTSGSSSGHRPPKNWC